MLPGFGVQDKELRSPGKFHEEPESEVEEPEVELAGEGATSQQSSSTNESATGSSWFFGG